LVQSGIYPFSRKNIWCLDNFPILGKLTSWMIDLLYRISAENRITGEFRNKRIEMSYYLNIHRLSTNIYHRGAKMTDFDIFAKHKYINLETFRKSGVGVKTPVWFVQEGDKLFVQTDADSGKVKRIRNNSQVNIAPCNMDGSLLGEWIPATASEINDANTGLKVNKLLDKKYGLMKKASSLASSVQGRKSTILVFKAREKTV
jgi:uncharacterized protein